MNIPFPPLRKTLWQLLGPSVVFVAVSLNGGELLLWPSLAANFTLSILWAIPIILVLQFVVNLEIERYSLVTGRSTEEHLVGSVRWLAVLFAFSVVVSLVWPAWMANAGNLVAELVLPSDVVESTARNVGLVVTTALLLLSIIVFRVRKSYSVIETISKYGLAVALVIILFTVVLNFDAGIFMEGLRGLTQWGFLPDNLPRFDFLAALAFGGVSGVLNLAQSEWVIDKKYGVAGVEASKRGSVEFASERSQRNFRSWFRMANKEHFILFFCANLFSIFLLSYLGRLLLPLGSAQGFGVLIGEIAVLNEQLPYLGVLFAVSGILIFIMANVAILDAIGRLTHRMLKPLGREHRLLSAGNISTAAIVIGVGILVLSLVFENLKQPFILLVISASLSAIVMWLYPPLLLKLNLQLPRQVRPSKWRMALLLLCTAFYGTVSLWALASWFPLWALVSVGVVVTAYQLWFLLRKTAP